MKKLLFMNDSIVYGGGVEKVLIELVNHLSIDEYDISILLPDEDKDFYKYFNNNIKYFIINRRLLKSGSHFAKMYNKIAGKINNQLCKLYIKSQRFDVAIAFKEGPCMQFISKLPITKKLAWIHSDYDVFHWTNDMFKDQEELDCMKSFDKVVCVSETVKKSILNTVGNPKNLCVKYNPINEQDIIRKSHEKVEGITKPKDKLLFVTVGRLAEQKGYDRLLKVCHQLREQSDLFELWIIGEGEYEKLLKDFIKENGLKNVKLLGLKYNPYKYIKMADWFICSSTSESFGIAIQEAIILGIPVITTNCPGACELFDEKIHGIIVENSEVDIFNGMSRILSNLQLDKSYKEKMEGNTRFISLEERIDSIIELF